MKFQYIILAIFGVIILVAVGVFASGGGKKGDTPANVRGVVKIWGTFPVEQVSPIISNVNNEVRDILSIEYSYHDPKNFDHDIVEALASNRGPDILILPDDLIVRHSDKIEPIPYSPQITPEWFNGTFIQAAEIYARNNGLISIPFAIDPMVMYWNRDIFSNTSLTQPPKYWDEIRALAPKLTIKNPKTFNITQSTIAFGEYDNVTHAKDILAMLFLQVGSPIVQVTQDNKFKLALEGDKGADSEMVSAFRFFMDFSNPLKDVYSWNLSRSDSLNEFINGNLALYFDHASAYDRIQKKNPHLNFAVAQVPLPRGTNTEITFAKVYGLSVLKNSKNRDSAVYVIQRLLESKTSDEFAKAFTLPPVRRDLLAHKPIDAAQSVFYDAAIRSRTWLDPEPKLSDTAYKNAVDGVSSGRYNVNQALGILSEQLSSILLTYK